MGTPGTSPAHLVLLGQLEAVVGLEAVSVLGHVGDGDGRVTEHACGKSTSMPREGRSRRGRGARGCAGQCESAMDQLGLEGTEGGQEGVGGGPEADPASVAGNTERPIKPDRPPCEFLVSSRTRPHPTPPQDITKLSVPCGDGQEADT